MEMDPILTPTLDRFTTFPIKYHTLWNLYKKAQASNWTAEEIDLSTDMTDWVKLGDDEKHFIKMVLAFFASSDGIVFENLQTNFSSEVQIAEARAFYSYQGYNENVHGETYSLLIDKYVSDQTEKDNLFSAIYTVPVISKKAEWAMKWFDKSRPFADRLMAFACVEGIFFSGSFCAIFWLKNRGIMPGLCFSNELISRDEGLHLEFAVELFRTLQTKTDTRTVHRIVREAVEIEKEFIIGALPCKLIGMDSVKMSKYIEYTADRMMKQFGYLTIYESENPFDWMETISLEGKTNFFEKRVGEYAKHMPHANDTIEFDADF